MNREAPPACPVCKARFRGEAECLRCGADLTPLMLLSAHAYWLRQAARRALETGDDERLCEERRVFYVACTRAKDHLFLTYARSRGGRPTAGPSQFLSEAGLIGHTSMAA